MTQSLLATGAAGWRRFLRFSLIAILIGQGVAFLVGLGNPGSYRWQTFAASGLIGLAINTMALVSEWLVLGAARWRSERTQRRLRPVAYGLGGMAGWTIGLELEGLLFGTSTLMRTARFWPSLLFFGLLAAVVGLVHYTGEELKDRLRRSVEQLKEQEFAAKELELARAIQRRLLPPPEIAGRGFRLAARNLPALYVAGDFYDVFPWREGGIGVVVGDVAGKGMGASLIMASVKAMLPFIAAGRSVAATLDELNRRLVADLGRREFVALALVRFDPESRQLELANAGLPDPYLLKPGAVPHLLATPGEHLPLGMRKGVGYSSTTTTLGLGEALLLFTDGLAEARDARHADGEPLGYDTLESLLAIDGAPPAATLDRLIAALRARTTPEQEDDWTLVLLESIELAPVDHVARPADE